MIDPTAPDYANTPAGDQRASFGYVAADPGAEPALSIVTPFFDTDPAIFEETVVSVRRQSLQQWEWIIVDDGSTLSASRDTLVRLSELDSRVRVVSREENHGLPSARNTGAAEARSDFILFLDSDDLLEPTAAEKWLWFLVSHPEHAFVKGFSVGFGAEQYLWRRGFHDRTAFLTANLVDPTCLVRRDVVRSVGGFDENLRGGLEDWEFWLRCAAAGFWGTTIPEYLNWYRRKPHAADRWRNWDEGPRQATLVRTWRQRYPQLWKRRFPVVTASPPSLDPELEASPCANRLAKARRRLLLVTAWTAIGGADKFNLDLIAQLDRRGWETTVVTTLHGDHSWMPEFAKVTPDVFALSHFLEPEDYPRFLRYLIRSREPEAILITQSAFAYEALAYLRQVADGIPISDYCHVVEDHWLDGGYPRLSVDRRDLLDLQISSSDDLREWMLDHGADLERTATCYTNIDTSEVFETASRSAFQLLESVPVIVYPCRMSAQKQPGVFVKTMLELRRRGCEFLAVAAGNGPYLPWMRRFVRRKKLGRHVRFLGAQSNASVRALIGMADLVFIPSAYEGISLVFYEAMAAGVPVVGADVGGQRELVTPECGVLIPRADPDTEVRRYADELAKLLDDPQLRQDMGAAARVRTRTHFALDEMGDRMDALLGRAAKLAASRPRSIPTAEEARRAALTAVRNVRLASPPPASQAATRFPRFRILAFRVLSRVGLPLYGLGLRLGMHWLEPLKDRVFEALYPRAD